MAQCREIVKLFENAGYIIENTAHSSSHQNGPGERPHQTLADGIRALLTGSGLPIAFWPCVLQHFVQLYNVCGQQPNLRHLWTFGFYKILSTGPRLMHARSTLEAYVLASTCNHGAARFDPSRHAHAF